MNHDLIDDWFGRYREIPLALARRGHDVRGLCLSYAPRGDGGAEDLDPVSGRSVTWSSVDLGRTLVPGLARFLMRGRQIVEGFRPDVIWAGSDAPFGSLGRALAKRHGALFLFDVYDDYDVFASTKVPGVRSSYHRSLREAHGVTSYSKAMMSHIVHDIGRRGPTHVLLSTADQRLFRPLEKTKSRQVLGLPLSATLIGVVGAMTGRQGIDTFLGAFEEMSVQEPNLHFVVAGPRSAKLQLPRHERFHDLGVVDHREVPTLLSSLDIGVVLPREGSAGSLGFPHRAYEIVACGVPIIAADVGAMSELLGEYPEALFEPSDVGDFERALRFQLANRHSPSEWVPDWDDMAESLEEFVQKIEGL